MAERCHCGWLLTPNGACPRCNGPAVFNSLPVAEQERVLASVDIAESTSRESTYRIALHRISLTPCYHDLDTPNERLLDEDEPCPACIAREALGAANGT